MSPASILGIGAVGGFGCGVEALAAALQAGSVPPAETSFELGGVPQRISAYLADPAPLSDFLPTRVTRRVDRFSRLALLGAELALVDAGRPEIAAGRLGVVICSGYGAAETTFRFLDSILDDGDACSSPTRFSNSVHNAAAAHISVLLDVTGPSLTVSQFELSFASGLLTATLWLAENRVDAVLCGGVDEFGSVLGYCWERFFGHAPGTRPEPLDFACQTAVPGEGAAFLLLGSAGAEARRGQLTTVELGQVSVGSAWKPGPKELLVLGADGHASTGIHYAAALGSGAVRPVSFAPCYGSFPAAQALDVAAAALHLGGESSESAACCLKLDGRGSFGKVRLRADRAETIRG